MSEWLKFVLAARRKDSDGGGLYQIIFFIAVAVIYALGGIFKKRARDKESEKPMGQPALDKQIETKPRYKSLSDTVASRQATRSSAQKSLPYARRTAHKRTAPSQIRQPQQTAQPTPREVIRQVLEPVFEPQKVEQRPQRRPRPSRRPQVQKPAAPKARKDLAYAKAAKPPKKKEPAAPAEAVPQPSGFASLEHLSQPDNLKMAIVYAEILGQPIGLRDI